MAKTNKYSLNWKMGQMNKNGGWAQKHADGYWRWHGLGYGIEYAWGKFHTKKECVAHYMGD